MSEEIRIYVADLAEYKQNKRYIHSNLKVQNGNAHPSFN